MKKILLLSLFLLPVVGFSQSTDEYLSALIRSYEDKKPFALEFSQGMTEAEGVQAKFVEHLSKTLGRPVGYKAALTNPGARRKFNVNEPVSGILLEKMLVSSGASVTAAFGVLPLLEGDMLVRVGSEAINDAETDAEFLAALDAFIPFIELPDLIFKKGNVLNGPAMVATNAGTRMGVKGSPITLKADAATVKALGKIRLEITDSKDNVVAYGYANELMNNPIKVVKWMRDAQKSKGVSLKKGDLLSLGSITRMVPVVGPETYTLAYFGIPGHDKVEVSVTFVE